jgi:hypothetical protein
LDKQLMTSGCGGCYVTQTIHVVFGTPWNLSKASTTSTPWCPFHVVPRNTVDVTSSNNIMLRAITCVHECTMAFYPPLTAYLKSWRCFQAN